MIRVTLDHAQKRVVRGRLYILITGGGERDPFTDNSIDGWDPRWGDVDANGEMLTYLDPITGRMFLKPAPMLQAWQDTGTGIYARLAKTDYTLTSASWQEENKNGDSSKFLVAKDSTFTEEVVTTTTWPKNRPFYLGWYIHNSGSDNRAYIRAGWGDTSTGVYIEAFASGQWFVYKDGVKVGGPYSWAGDKVPKGGYQSFVKLFLMPMAGRDLLVFSDQGSGDVHTFEDIDEDEADPTITPADNFFWQVFGCKPEVECAPIRFASSAYRSSIPLNFAAAPETGLSPNISTYYRSPGYGASTFTTALVNKDANTAFTPDGVTYECRLRVTLTSDGEGTEVIYGASAEFESALDDTDATESLDVTETFLTALNLEVTENPAGCKASITLKEPDAIELISDRLIDTIGNRPILIDLNTDLSQDGSPDFSDVQILNGIGGAPKRTDSWNDEVRRIVIEVRDKWKLLENYRFKDPTPLDGDNIEDSFEMIFESVGIPSTEYDISAIAADVRSSPGAGRGDWNFIITPDMTAAEAVLKLHDTYIANWFLGFRPQASGPPKLSVLSPDDLPGTHVITLFDNMANALAYTQGTLLLSGAASITLAKALVYNSFEEDALEPEANQIWVQGIDRRTRRPILSYKADSDSIDPVTAPSMRPDNWLGETRRYGYSNSAFNLRSECDDAVSRLYPKLTVVRYMAQIRAQFLVDPVTGVPLWRGDVVRLQNKGDYRIQAFSVESFQEAGSFVHGHQWRPARYVLERLPVGRSDTQGLGYNRLWGSNLGAMAAMHRASLNLAGNFDDQAYTLRAPTSLSVVP